LRRARRFAGEKREATKICSAAHSLPPPLPANSLNPLYSFAGNTELTNELAWSHTGDFLATSCKDKLVRVINARDGTLKCEFQPHEGSKTVKVVYLGDDNMLATVGFTKQSQREMKIWDLSKVSGKRDPLF